MHGDFVRTIREVAAGKVDELDLTTNKQNDLISEDKNGDDIYIRNKQGYHCLTDNIKEIKDGYGDIYYPDKDENNQATLPKYVKSVNSKLPDNNGNVFDPHFEYVNSDTWRPVNLSLTVGETRMILFASNVVNVFFPDYPTVLSGTVSRETSDMYTFNLSGFEGTRFFVASWTITAGFKITEIGVGGGTGAYSVYVNTEGWLANSDTVELDIGGSCGFLGTTAWANPIIGSTGNTLFGTIYRYSATTYYVLGWVSKNGNIYAVYLTCANNVWSVGQYLPFIHLVNAPITQDEFGNLGFAYSATDFGLNSSGELILNQAVSSLDAHTYPLYKQDNEIGLYYDSQYFTLNGSYLSLSPQIIQRLDQIVNTKANAPIKYESSTGEIDIGLNTVYFRVSTGGLLTLAATTVNNLEKISNLKSIDPITYDENSGEIGLAIDDSTLYLEDGKLSVKGMDYKSTSTAWHVGEFKGACDYTGIKFNGEHVFRIRLPELKTTDIPDNKDFISPGKLKQIWIDDSMSWVRVVDPSGAETNYSAGQFLTVSNDCKAWRNPLLGSGLGDGYTYYINLTLNCILERV